MSTLSTRIILDEYQTNHILYNDFSYVMSNLLEDILKKGEFKYHIKNRLKDATSLSEKINRKKVAGIQYKHIQDIVDVVGIRIVFYTEIDRKRFIRNMHLDFGGAMQIKKTNGPNGYSSTHVIASLGEKRSQLSEYKRFKDLKCEIQLTLILTHAWAEVEHDILYKAGKKVRKIDEKHYENLKGRMKKIMSQHIQRASFELENIVKEIKNIKIVKRQNGSKRQKIQ